MPSQGLGPRQSVLPLLISFLFSHIVLASLPPPLPPLSSHPPSSPALSLPIVLFPSLFFLSLPFPLHISPRGLSLSPGLRLISHRGNPRVRFTPRAREEVLIPVSRHGSSLLSHLRAIDSRDDPATSRGSTLVDRAARCYLNSVTRSTRIRSSCKSFVRNPDIIYWRNNSSIIRSLKRLRKLLIIGIHCK